MVPGSNLPSGSQPGPHPELSRNVNLSQYERLDCTEHALLEPL